LEPTPIDDKQLPIAKTHHQANLERSVDVNKAEKEMLQSPTELKSEYKKIKEKNKSRKERSRSKEIIRECGEVKPVKTKKVLSRKSDSEDSWICVGEIQITY
jgi:hypothetical protein